MNHKPSPSNKHLLLTTLAFAMIVSLPFLSCGQDEESLAEESRQMMPLISQDGTKGGANDSEEQETETPMSDPFEAVVGHDERDPRDQTVEWTDDEEKSSSK